MAGQAVLQPQAYYPKPVMVTAGKDLTGMEGPHPEHLSATPVWGPPHAAPMQPAVGRGPSCRWFRQMRPLPDDPASSRGQGPAVQSSAGPGEQEAGSIKQQHGGAAGARELWKS